MMRERKGRLATLYMRGGQEEEEAISDSVWCQSILSALEAEMQEASILISPLYCDFM